METNEQCSNCIFLLEINKHPWNEGSNKGKVTERNGFGCSIMFEESLKQKQPKITYFDLNDGSCEMFTTKDKYELTFKIEEL